MTRVAGASPSSQDNSSRHRAEEFDPHRCGVHGGMDACRCAGTHFATACRCGRSSPRRTRACTAGRLIGSSCSSATSTTSPSPKTGDAQHCLVGAMEFSVRIPPRGLHDNVVVSHRGTQPRTALEAGYVLRLGEWQRGSIAMGESPGACSAGVLKTCCSRDELVVSARLDVLKGSLHAPCPVTTETECSLPAIPCCSPSSI